MTITAREWDSLLRLHEAGDVQTSDLIAVLLLTGEQVEAELSAARVRRARRQGGRTLMTPVLQRPDLPARYWRGRSGFSLIDLF